MNTSLQNAAALAGRILIAAIFIWSGFGKLMLFAGTVAYIKGKGLPAAELLAVAAILCELLGGTLIGIGWRTRWAAAAVFLFMIPVTLIFHNPAQGQEQLIHFMKNLSIMGGLLLVFAFGPGRLSADRA